MATTAVHVRVGIPTVLPTGTTAVHVDPHVVPVGTVCGSKISECDRGAHFCS